MPALQSLLIDFESYYDKDCSLTKLSYTDYINHPDFFVYGAAIWDLGSSQRPYFLNYVDLAQFIAAQPWESTELVAHNMAFDGYLLHRVYGKHPARYACTLSMARGVLQGAAQSNSLLNVAKHLGFGNKGGFLGHIKGKRILTPQEWRDLAEYAEQDAYLGGRIYAHLVRELSPSEMDLIDFTCRLACEPKLRVNRAIAEEARNEDVEEKNAILARVDADRKLLGGSESFAQLLRDAGAEPPTKQGKRGEIYAFAKTDPGFQDLLTHENPLVVALAEARQAVQSTTTETRADRLIREANRGELPVFLRYFGAHTGRWSGDNKINLQNLVRGSKLRTCIEAPEGHVLVVMDLAQIEVRVLYALVQQTDGLDEFRLGIDPYNSMASKIYNRPIDRKNVDEDFLPGFIGKCTVLGCGFGMGWRHFMLALTLGKLGGEKVIISEEEAQTAVEGYRNSRLQVKKSWAEGQRLLNHMCWGSMDLYDSWLEGVSVSRDEKRIYLPGDTYLHFPNLAWDDHKEQFVYTHGKRVIKTYGARIIENIVQAIARNLMAAAMLDTNKRFPVVTTTHDETVSLAPVEQAEEALSFIHDRMCQPPSWMPDIPLAAEGGWARNYSK